MVHKVQNILMLRVYILHSANEAGCAAELNGIRLQCIYSSMAELMHNAGLCSSSSQKTMCESIPLPVDDPGSSC